MAENGSLTDLLNFPNTQDIDDPELVAISNRFGSDTDEILPDRQSLLTPSPSNFEEINLHRTQRSPSIASCISHTSNISNNSGRCISPMRKQLLEMSKTIAEQKKKLMELEKSSSNLDKKSSDKKSASKTKEKKTGRNMKKKDEDKEKEKKNENNESSVNDRPDVPAENIRKRKSASNQSVKNKLPTDESDENIIIERKKVY